MSVYSINYDLKQPGQQYAGLYEAIKSLGAWLHYLDSCWLVDTHLTAEGIWGRLKAHVDKNDSMLIIDVGSDYAGWLSNDAWEWIRSRSLARR